MVVNFRHGIIAGPTSPTTGYVNFLTVQGSTVSIVLTNKPLVFTIAQGPANYLFTISNDVPAAWKNFGTATYPSGVDYHLYVDIHRTTGVVTYGQTRYEPIVSKTAPRNPRLDQHWFDTTTIRHKVWQGTQWVERIRLFFGKFINSSTIQGRHLGTQIGIAQPTLAGKIIYADNGLPVRKSTGEFFTTEDSIFTDGKLYGPDTLDARLTPAVTAETVPQAAVVRFTGFSTVSLASYENTSTDLIAITRYAATVNSTVDVRFSGVITNSGWNWSTPGALLWVDRSGQLTETNPGATDTWRGQHPPVARALTPTEIWFAPTATPVETSETSVITDVALYDKATHPLNGGTDEQAVTVFERRDGVVTITNAKTGVEQVELTDDGVEFAAPVEAPSFAPKSNGTITESVIDPLTASSFRVVVSAPTALEIAPIPTDRVVTFDLIIENGGSEEFTWWDTIEWPSGRRPVLSTTGTDVVRFTTYNGGAPWYGHVVGLDMQEFVPSTATVTINAIGSYVEGTPITITGTTNQPSVEVTVPTATVPFPGTVTALGNWSVVIPSQSTKVAGAYTATANAGPAMATRSYETVQTTLLINPISSIKLGQNLVVSGTTNHQAVTVLLSYNDTVYPTIINPVAGTWAVQIPGSEFTSAATFTVTAYAGSAFAERTTEVIAPAPGIIPPSQTLTAEVGTTITPTAALTTVDILGTVTYSISPALPAGLSFNSTTGRITGTPSAPTPLTTYTITGTGSISGIATTNVELRVRAAPAIVPATQTIVAATDTPVETASITASDFEGAVTYGISPALPSGFSFDTSTGIVTGTSSVPIPQATYTITATGATYGTATATVTLAVKQAATITPATQTIAGEVNAVLPATSEFVANNFEGVITYSISPALPSGLTMSSSTGVISGTPTATVASSLYTVTATGTTFGTATATVNITVAAAVVTLSPSTQTKLWTLNVEADPTTALTASGFGGTVTYSISTPLSDGLTLDTTTGVISGTPTTITSGPVTIMITATGSLNGSTTATIEYEVEPLPMIMEHDVTSTGNVATIFPRSAPIVVDWGDGTVQTVSSLTTTLTHTYGTSGLKTVTIRKYLDAYGTNTIVAGASSLRRIVQFGGVCRGLIGLARGATNLIEVPAILPSGVTSLAGAFDGATSFNQNIGGWDTSAVTNMDRMFTNAQAFNNGGSTTIGNWDVSNVTNMTQMFAGSAFNQSIGDWDTSSVTTMSAMFAGSAFNQPIGDWNTGSVINMSYMFANASAFNQNLSGWVTGLTGQPDAFSFGANPTWVASKSTKFPFLSDGTTRINT